MSGKKILEIDKTYAYKSKYEKPEEFKNSIFQDVYFQAYDCLVDIVKTKEDLKKFNLNVRNFDANNIISFVGERGCGKTSCMKNFRRSFKENKDIVEGFYKKRKFPTGKNAKNINEYEGVENIFKHRFELLSVIDPSLFSTKDSVVEIIVAQMFNRFKDKNIKYENDDVYEKQEILEKFEKVYKDIRIINSNKSIIYENNFDCLETLDSLSSAVSLREDLNELIIKYIKYMSGENNGYLLISIDDIDMSLSVGDKMLEDIRKYLIIPNAIILMAVKIEQLKDIVTQKYLYYLKENEILYKSLDSLMDSSYLLSEFKKEIEFRTDKYLEKILPFNRRVYIENIKIEDITIRYNKKTVFINSLINKKLNLKTKTNIIPNNLRTFIYLVNLLEGFDDNDKSENTKRFYRFYMECMNNLKKDYYGHI